MGHWGPRQAGPRSRHPTCHARELRLSPGSDGWLRQDKMGFRKLPLDAAWKTHWKRGKIRIKRAGGKTLQHGQDMVRTMDVGIGREGLQHIRKLNQYDPTKLKQLEQLLYVFYVPGSILYTLRAWTHPLLTKLCEVGSVINLLLRMRKLKHGYKWQSQDLNPGGLVLENKDSANLLWNFSAFADKICFPVLCDFTFHLRILVWTLIQEFF